jgi:DNA-binding NtrC family response regulator
MGHAFALGAQPALEALQNGVYDVVVADARTPGHHGESLLEAVQELHPGLVRVALSERPGEAAALRASRRSRTAS